MNRKKLSVSARWLALLFLIFGSCENSTIENQHDGVVLKVQTQDPRPQAALIDVITLEHPEAGPFLGRVGSIAVAEDYIIILDTMRKSVEVFDREGSYKRSIGSRGDGEGQYKIPSCPTIIPNTDQILIYDGGAGQTLRFSIKGEFLGQVKLSERRFINRMLVFEDHNLIHTYVDKNKNGMLCVTSLGTGEDLAKFKVCEAPYSRLFFTYQIYQGLAYDETRKLIYFTLPWEEKIMRIDLITQKFLTPIVINHPEFVSLELDELDDSEDIVRESAQIGFSKLYGMYLLSSSDILLNYRFWGSSTALILLSDLSMRPSAQEVKNELGYKSFTCYGKSIYAYSPPANGEDTNGKIRVYRLTEHQEAPTRQ